MSIRSSSHLFRCIAAACLLAWGAQAHALSAAPPIAPSPAPEFTSNFTCNSKTGMCKCQGTQDCFDLGSSGLCVDNTFSDSVSKPQAGQCAFRFRKVDKKPLQE